MKIVHYEKLKDLVLFPSGEQVTKKVFLEKYPMAKLANMYVITDDDYNMVKEITNIDDAVVNYSIDKTLNIETKIMALENVRNNSIQDADVSILKSPVPGVTYTHVGGTTDKYTKNSIYFFDGKNFIDKTPKKNNSELTNDRIAAALEFLALSAMPDVN